MSRTVSETDGCLGDEHGFVAETRACLGDADLSRRRQRVCLGDESGLLRHVEKFSNEQICMSRNSPVCLEIGFVSETRACLGDESGFVAETRVCLGDKCGFASETRLCLGDDSGFVSETSACLERCGTRAGEEGGVL